MDKDRLVWQVARPASRWPLVGLTVLIHLFLAWVFLKEAAVLADLPGAPVTRMTWIDLPAVQPKHEPAKPQLPKPTPATPVKAKPAFKPERQRVAQQAIVAEPAITLIEAPAAPSNAAPAEPVFDRSAALATARTLAHERDPARAGSALAQFDGGEALQETETETLGRKIASGKRQSCIGPNAKGNLLTPLGWLLQKKGSGCKF